MLESAFRPSILTSQEDALGKDTRYLNPRKDGLAQRVAPLRAQE